MKQRCSRETFGLAIVIVMLVLMPSVHAEAIIIDHTCTDISQIPADWINQSKAMFNLSYGHTSHGSQIVTGMNVIKNPAGSLYWWDHDGTQDGLSLHDRTPSGDLGNPDRYTWESRTRAMLDNPGNDRNMVMWSWCGQVNGNEAEIQQYLDLMTELEADYPDVVFIYMTGHLNAGGAEGNVNQRNNQIQTHCSIGDRVLFDFADIESYDPDGDTNFMELYANDNCNYNGGNWADEWCDAHNDSALCTDCGCAHSKPLNCNLKAKAFWWMMARLAGWDGLPEDDVIYVPGDYTSIQAAVNAAIAGDTIIVQDGTYYENVNVDKRLTIRSENGAASATVQAANSSEHVFDVTADYTNISGFHVTGATDKTGIFLDWANYCNISDNYASDNEYGIGLWFSDYNTFMNNIANSNTGRGFDLLNSNHNTLQNNTAKRNAGNSWSCGICAYRNFGLADYNTIVNNTVNSNGGYGGILLYNANNSYIAGNTINANTYGIYVRSWYGWMQTSPGSSDHNTIIDNNIINNSIAGVVMASLTAYGVEHRTENNTIYNNYFNNTDNIYFAGPKYENTWNITNTTGPNIIGGLYLGGNYWSDYTGNDGNGDGFGDTAYNITDGTNKDYLPLVHVQGICGDVDGNGLVNIMDVRLLMNHVNDPVEYPVDSWAGDVNGGGISIGDVELLLAHVFDPVGHELMCD